MYEWHYTERISDSGERQPDGEFSWTFREWSSGFARERGVRSAIPGGAGESPREGALVAFDSAVAHSVGVAMVVTALPRRRVVF
jgi:hypothetical protein